MPRALTIWWCHQIPSWRDRLVWVDVHKIDRAWRRAIGIRIRPGERDERCLSFERWLRDNPGRPVFAPYASYWKGAVDFTDGRHRFAWCRDHGVRALQLTVPREQRELFARRYGTRLRRSVAAFWEPMRTWKGPEL